MLLRSTEVLPAAAKICSKKVLLRYLFGRFSPPSLLSQIKIKNLYSSRAVQGCGPADQQDLPPASKTCRRLARLAEWRDWPSARLARLAVLQDRLSCKTGRLARIARLAFLQDWPSSKTGRLARLTVLPDWPSSKTGRLARSADLQDRPASKTGRLARLPSCKAGRLAILAE